MHKEIVAFLHTLREDIINAFNTLENTPFERETWEHHTGGGGEIALLRGHTFEKAAVNISTVSGPEFPLKEEHKEGPFFATGLSLITHMNNPHAPTVHMNLRFFSTPSQQWLGGGYDLTPMGFPYEEDTLHFHNTAKKSLEPFGSHWYTEFSRQARNYFFIPHYQKERGVGGLFFDHLPLEMLPLWKAIGLSFLPAILPIYQRRCPLSFTAKEKKIQTEQRARYVEFNLLYDKGTRFGFASQGNPKAILCSLPPLACW